ncbi:MAG TPA: carboxylesterase family protein [Mucilaginibacter sp.]
MKKLYPFAAFALLLCIAGLFYSFKMNGNLTLPGIIKVEGGAITGLPSQAGDVVSFKGIPFAAPPVGNLRWKAPQPVIPWNGVKNCADFGPSPMQNKPVPFGVYTKEFLIPEKPISEDCLYLNVWAKNSGAAKKPVFVWIYGGGFGSGGAGVPIYDGEAMARKGIIFVSINYRVGIFGFLAHPELTKESPGKASGNYGLMDQIAALKWVKHNIAKFGGDPNNVTIGGQSAGSMSVNCLVASPLAKELFNKAIAESGSLMLTKGGFNAGNLTDAEQQGVRIAASLHAASLEDLRKIPAVDLLKAPAQYAPIVDRYVLPEPVSKIIAEGKGNKVSLLIGWNADEGFVMRNETKEQFQKEAKDKYGKDADEFLHFFPSNTEAEVAQSQLKLSRDMIFAVSGYKWAGMHAAAGKAPVYVYYFQHKLPATPDFEKYGAFHTGEVTYALDNLKFLNRPWKAADQPLADQISGYWANFIKTGNPNGGNLPVWPKYSRSQNKVMVFGETSMPRTLPDKEELQFMTEHL